jgi:hypothetical protein
LAVTAAGTSVTVSTYTVVSSGEITATVRPDASEPTENATLSVWDTDEQSDSITAQIDGCFIPTTETTAFQGWDTAQSYPTIGNWEQTVSDANGDILSGYKIQEVSPQAGVDTCWWPKSKYAKITTVTGSSWFVNGDNTWGPDQVGMYPIPLSYYRANNRAPCGITVYQQMQIQCPDNSWYNYGDVNTLQGSFTNSTVTSVRAGGTATRRY